MVCFRPVSIYLNGENINLYNNMQTADVETHTHTCHWRRKRRGGAGGGMCPPTFERGGQRYVCAPPPHFQTQNVGLGIEPTDICDVTLAWLASRCWARQMCPPPHILSRSYAVACVLYVHIMYTCDM